MKIDSSVFKDMNSEFIELFVKSEDNEAFYKNYHILVVDGSKSEIPNTPESREWANIKNDSLTVTKPSRVLFFNDNGRENRNCTRFYHWKIRFQ